MSINQEDDENVEHPLSSSTTSSKLNLLSPEVLDGFIENIFDTFSGGSSPSKIRRKQQQKSNSNNNKNKTTVPFFEKNFVTQLILQCREITMAQPMVITDINLPVKVAGDIHGQFPDLIKLFEICGMPSEKTSYLFLGDYVDRGQHSIEVMCLLIAFKIRFPDNVFLLRGNHECSNMHTYYGFFDECKQKYSSSSSSSSVRLWKTFCNFFNSLPVSAIIEEKIFCCHGGISPHIMQQQQLRMVNKYSRPCEIPSEGVLCDLLWSDPRDTDDEFDEEDYDDDDDEHQREEEQTSKKSKKHKNRRKEKQNSRFPEQRKKLKNSNKNVAGGWRENQDRGISYVFGKALITEFLFNHDFDLIVRGHQIVEEGYEFFGSCDSNNENENDESNSNSSNSNRQLVTVFSAPNYCGEFTNHGAVLCINSDDGDEKLKCSFEILKGG